MSYLRKQIKEWLDAVDLLASFDTNYGDKLPDGLAFGSLACGTPQVMLSIGHTSDDRNKALALYGDIFGRDGWEMTPSVSSRSTFDWERVVDGVKVVIYGAEKFPEREQRAPVPPQKFPLQLEGGAQ